MNGRMEGGGLKECSNVWHRGSLRPILRNGRIHRGGCTETPPARAPAPQESAVVEFLNLILILAAAYLVLKQPERERAAFRILVVSSVLMVFLFTLATRSGMLPGVNY
jgi:hypothetical protein